VPQSKDAPRDVPESAAAAALALPARIATGAVTFTKTWAFRVVVLYVALFAVSVLALLGFIYVTTVGYIDRQINATVLADINGLSERYREHGLAGLVEVVTERIAADRTGESVYLLTDSEYQPVAGNLARWPSDLERQSRWYTFAIVHAESGQEQTVNAEPAPTGDEARAMTFLLSEGYHLLVGRNLRERSNFENLIVQSLFWSLMMTAGLGLVGGVVMSRDMRRRLEAINRTTLQIMRGDLTHRMPVSGGDDEFDRLATNLNAMLGQIDRLMRAMREVSDNVAHDLRSPLTRLKTRLEVTLLSSAAARGADPTTDGYRQAIEQTVADTDRILGTFNALLSIAQAESGSSRGEVEAVDLNTLIADVAELYEPVADTRGLALTSALYSEGLTVYGNRHLLFQAVSNLVDNAIKYAGADDSHAAADGANGAVRLVLRRDGADAVLTVADTGPGIPEADRVRVLQRFVRLEHSRSTPGNGLGLSLVAAVVAMHGGAIELDDGDAAIGADIAPRPGLRVTVRLPLAAGGASQPT
jgi:signal transduction histidine kinase